MLPAKSREDIDFELVNLDEVKLGDGFSITVNIHVRYGQFLGAREFFSMLQLLWNISYDTVCVEESLRKRCALLYTIVKWTRIG